MLCFSKDKAIGLETGLEILNRDVNPISQLLTVQTTDPPVSISHESKIALQDKSELDANA